MKLKRIMAIVLCFAMVLSTMSFSVFATGSTVTTEVDLKAALAAGGTVVLGTDINVAEQIEIPEGIEVTLDLSGYDIIGGWNGASTTNHIYALSNKGKLTITDSVGDGKITSRGIYNYGTLTLENGTIDACDGNGGYAVNNESGSVFIMNGGSVTADYEDGDAPVSGNYDATALDVPENCTATLNGGTISNAGNFTFAISVEGELIVPEDSTVSVTGVHGTVAVMGGEANIAGGTFNLVGSPNVTDSLIYVPSGTANITGGSFDASETLSSSGRIIGAYDSGKVTVNGGTFTSNGWFDFADSSIENVTVNDAICVECDDTVKSYVAENATIILNGESYTAPAEGGSGTEEDIILINTAEDLIALRDAVNSGDNYAGKYVMLNDDIDLSSVSNWTPIGDVLYNSNYAPADTTKVFSGTFDGNDKVISNLKIEKFLNDAEEGPDADANLGLFGIIGEGAVIKDLTITNVDINTDGRNVGALAGVAYKATLDNITVNGDIQIIGGNNVCGVCAMTRYYDVSATNITVSGEEGSYINGNNIVAGMFAEIAPNGSNQTFENLSVENVAINGVGGVGGIVGLLTNGSVSNVSVKNVELVGNTEWPAGGEDRIRIGSIAGLLGSNNATISGVTVENVTAKNLDDEDVVLPVVGANYGASSNATEAKIGDTYYATLAKAVAAAEEGDTVTLLCDIENVIEIPDGVALDKNGYRFGDSLTGMGTEEDPYLINNIDDLVWFRNDVNAGNTYEGKYVKLTADIDLEGYQEANISGNFQSTFRPIGDSGCSASFNGTFDGGDHTISNLSQSGWDLGYEWGSYGSLGLFGVIDGATVENLTVKDFELVVEGGDVAAISGSAQGTCVFRNINVEGCICATYNNGCGSIVAWSGAGNYTFENIKIDDEVVLAGLWGSFDSSIGGVVGQAEPGATYNLKNVDIACRLDAYNDCTASYDYYNYRMCGMIIGRLEETTTVDGRNYPDMSKYNITCDNVNVTIGEWANYHYCEPTPGLNGGRGMRVEPGYAYDGLPADFDHSQCTTNHMALMQFEQLFGGDQLGVAGADKTILEKQGFDTSTLTVVDLAKIADCVAKIGDDGFETLSAAITAAKPDDTIILLADVNEDVTIDKNISLDGNGKTYTGTMILDSAITATIENVNFVNGWITKDTKSTKGNYTIKNCTFDGEGARDYSLRFKGAASITVENCDIKDYKYSFLYVTSGTNTVSVKNVTVEGCPNYAVYFASGVNSATIETLTVKNSNNGFIINNTANRALTIKDCKMENVGTAINHTNGTKTITCTVLGANDFGTSASSEYAKYVLGENATLKAPEGYTVTASNDAYFVKYVDGIYKSVKAVAQVGEVKYGSLAEAIAVGGDVILLADVENAGKIVVNKDVSLDLNGKTISGVCDEGQKYVFMVNNGVAMNIKDSSAEKTGKITYAGNNSTGWIIDVEGNLVLESGTLELTGTWDIGYAVDVRPNAWGTPYTEETSFVMDGGKITSSDGAVRVASSSADTYKDVSASFTMNGGEIEAAWDGVFVQQSNAAWDVLSFTINDGTIKSGLNPVRLYGPAATSYVNGENCIDIALNGGELEYTGTEAREWLVDGIIRIGGGAAADEFVKNSTVTASADFAQSNVADGYSWVSIGNKYQLQILGGYVFVVDPAETELVQGTNETFTVDVKVASEKVDTFYTAEYIVKYDTALLTCAEDNAANDYDKTVGVLRLQALGTNTNVGESIGTLTFTAKEFDLTKETKIEVAGSVLATQFDSITGNSVEAAPGEGIVVMKETLEVTVGEGLEGDNVAYNGTDYVISVAEENQGKQNTVNYTINGDEYSVVLPAGTNEFTIEGDKITGNMTFEIADSFTVTVIAPYVTGYALVLVEGTADGYTYDGHQMFKIDRATEGATLNYNGRYGWLVDGSAEGTTIESVTEAAYKAITAGGVSASVETTCNVNSCFVKDGKINFQDVSAAYACQRIDFALTEADMYYFMELYLASDVNCDGIVNVLDTAMISNSYN